MNLLERLLYRDGLMLVIDKPGKWVVHGPARGARNLEPLFADLKFGLPRSPTPAHRLDYGTSGCLVLGRHPKALRRLHRLFQGHEVEKRYWALVQGQPPKNQGSVDHPLLKVADSGSGLVMAIHPEGQPALTHYRTLGQVGNMTWLELILVTGRTHQIRVHCQSLGCPVVGDKRYGENIGGELYLHARQIILPLYPNRPPITVTAPPPPHMKNTLSSFANAWE
ncbi:MAG: Pseudouridine synthase [Magnetococcales bacterium]|nr:Pseudouridine synthase [Magnetococcales bacterium]